ncbi:putative motility protein [Thiocystis violacea]|uniref:putative motility protein n=1 Tax=Thiocystis violacea TaxID=13725 RepID=UPI001905F836|nr:putative motility protein [Thiocystis violacea]MBK1721336.1 hypothetical protein [Thiocystis violacea]
MDVSSVNALPSYTPATASTQSGTGVEVATLKKSMDLQADMATQLVQGIPDASAGLSEGASTGRREGVGAIIDVTA